MMLALAATVMVATSPGGPALELHQHAGPCVNGARVAIYVPRDGERIPGCWILRGTTVHVVFLDGDAGTLPIAAFKPAEGL